MSTDWPRNAELLDVTSRRIVYRISITSVENRCNNNSNKNSTACGLAVCVCVCERERERERERDD